MRSRKARTSEWLAGRSYVSPEDFAALCAAVGGSVGYLRRLVRESGARMHPLVEGVRQETLEELERTLLAMKNEPAYRALVLTAKEHARLSLRSPRTDRAMKQEMLTWMTVWLQTPELFAGWVALRKRARAAVIEV